MVIFTLFQNLTTLFISTLKMTNLFRGCITLYISTLIYTALIQRLSTLQIPTLKYKTLFQHWFDIAPRRDVVSTKRQRWNKVEMFAGISSLHNRWLVDLKIIGMVDTAYIRMCFRFYFIVWNISINREKWRGFKLGKFLSRKNDFFL